MSRRPHPGTGVEPERVPAEPEPPLQILARRLPPPGPANVVLVVAAAAVAVAGSLVFAVSLVTGGPLPLYGGALSVALFALVFVVRRVFAASYPQVHAAEPRPQTGMRPDDAPLAAVDPLPRRRLLRRLVGTAAALTGMSLLAPLASLGPARRDVQEATRWSAGTRLVTPLGEPIRPDDVPAGGMVTVWPEVVGEAVGRTVRSETAAVVLVRLSARGPQPPTDLRWVVTGDLVAYSKVCTHMGCPVGLFQEELDTLFCPCHQQTFDAARAAAPTFGPAARALPQLPLGVDTDGYLVALGDFVDPVGPAVG